MTQPELDPEPDKRMTFPNPMLVVVSGPSGVGKSTIVAELAERRPQVVPIVTATTRDRREGEMDKVHYHFLSLDEFERMRDEGGLLESAQRARPLVRHADRAGARHPGRRARRDPDHRPAGRPLRSGSACRTRC